MTGHDYTILLVLRISVRSDGQVWRAGGGQQIIRKVAISLYKYGGVLLGPAVDGPKILTERVFKGGVRGRA